MESPKNSAKIVHADFEECAKIGDKLNLAKMFAYAFHCVKCPELPVMMPFSDTKNMPVADAP